MSGGTGARDLHRLGNVVQPCMTSVSHRKLNQQLHHMTMSLDMSSLAGLSLSFNYFHLLTLTSIGVEARIKNVGP